jgi:hypothetical protein
MHTALRAWPLALVLGACGPGAEPADPDAGAPDARPPDAAPPDAAPPDAGPWPEAPKSGEFAWARTFQASTGLTTLAAAPDGTVVMATVQHGALDLGAVAVPDARGLLVARFDARGEALWARSLPGDTPNEHLSLAVGTDGAIAVGFSMFGALDGTPENEGASQNGYVVHLTAGGAVDWIRVVSTDDWDTVSDVAIAADGAVVAAGHLDASIDLGSGPLAAGAFVARYTATGDLVWSRSWPAGYSSTSHVAPLPDGGVVVAGDLHGTVELDDVRLAQSVHEDRMVVTFTPAGRAVRGFAIVDEGNATLVDVARAPSGEVYVVGNNAGGRLVVGDLALPGDGSYDPFLIAIAADGAPSWMRRVPADRASEALAVATDDTSVYLTGTCHGLIRLADPITCSEPETFVAAWNHAGELRWTTSLGGQASGLAMAPGDRLFFAGDGGATSRFGDVVVPPGGLYIGEVIP